MDSDSWIRLSATSRRFQYRSDVFQGREGFDSTEESRPEFLCPFCGEDFDVLGLCCHIDEEHVVEAKNGVCPVCAKRIGMDLVGHFTSQHGNLLRIQRKRRLRKVSSNSTLSILRKELRGGHLDSFLCGSPFSVASSNAEADPLLSSFIYNPIVAEESPEIQPDPSTAVCKVVESSTESSSKSDKDIRRNLQQPSLSDKDNREKAERCRFVQELLLSTFPDHL